MEKSNSSKFMKFLATNHDTENVFDVLAKPIDGSIPFQSNNNKNCDKPKSFPLHNKFHDNVMSVNANVNPFTPPGISMRSKNKKRARFDIGGDSYHNSSLPTILSRTNNVKWNHSNVMSTNKPSAFNFNTTNHNNNIATDSFELCYDEDLNEFRQAPKRLALQDSNITRYDKEFVELKLLGVGDFGLVYQCLNRLDGCIYAIKRSIKPVAGSSFE